MSIELERRGIVALVDQLEGLGRRGENLAPAFEAVADDFRDLQRARFAGGARWAPVSAEWAARKARQGKPTRALSYSGDLRDSFVVETDRYHRETIKPDSVTVVSRSPLVNLVAGNPPGRGHGKGRELVELTRQDERRWRRIVELYVLRGQTP